LYHIIDIRKNRLNGRGEKRKKEKEEKRDDLEISPKCTEKGFGISKT